MQTVKKNKYPIEAILFFIASLFIRNFSFILKREPRYFDSYEAGLILLLCSVVVFFAKSLLAPENLNKKIFVIVASALHITGAILYFNGRGYSFSLTVLSVILGCLWILSFVLIIIFYCQSKKSIMFPIVSSILYLAFPIYFYLPIIIRELQLIAQDSEYYSIYGDVFSNFIASIVIAIALFLMMLREEKLYTEIKVKTVSDKKEEKTQVVKRTKFPIDAIIFFVASLFMVNFSDIIYNSLLRHGSGRGIEIYELGSILLLVSVGTFVFLSLLPFENANKKVFLIIASLLHIAGLITRYDLYLVFKNPASYHIFGYLSIISFILMIVFYYRKKKTITIPIVSTVLYIVFPLYYYFPLCIRELRAIAMNSRYSFYIIFWLYLSIVISWIIIGAAFLMMMLRVIKPYKEIQVNTVLDNKKTNAEDIYCEIPKHILLCIFTFGIWYCIWIYRATKFLNQAQEGEQYDPTNKLLLCLFVPFYQIYWYYKHGQKLDSLMKERKISGSNMATLCLILGIFIPVVACILMQDKFNLLCTAINKPQKENPIDSENSTIANLEKYKNLLDRGIITQEEFDAKKKQLLGL